MLQVASLFQCYQNEFLMKKTLGTFRKFSEHFRKNQFIYQFYFILFHHHLHHHHHQQRCECNLFSKYANVKQMTSKLKT